MAADQLLATRAHLTTIAAALSAWLPGTPTVAVVEPVPSGPTPFVVVSGTLQPIRFGLDGKWSMARLTLVAQSVHDTAAQAQALGDLVRTWVLTVMAVAGQIDVEPAGPWYPDDPGGVQQGREAWDVTLVRV